MSAPRKNAIEQRLDRLAGMWNEFAELPQAKLLRWIVEDDSVRMVDLFLEMQNEEVGEVPDLFIRFSEPFEGGERYGFALRQSLIDQYEDIREGLGDAGLATDWRPAEKASDSSAAALARACTSLRKYYEHIMLHLVVVLMPPQISDVGDWVAWLDELITLETSPNLRVLVVERSESPRLDDLAAKHPERIVTTRPDLDMPGAYAELVRDVPGSGPGFEFRRLFVALSSAAAGGQVAAAQSTADRALKIAAEQKWPQMQSVIHMTLASAFLAAGQSAAALASYRSANKAIAGTDDPAATKLDIHTRFAEASVLIKEQEYAQAADVYEQIAPLAETCQDHFSMLESRRMAAYCRLQTGDYQRAWHEGQLALAVGELMDKETRAASTLPYVGQGLLQVVDGRYEAKYGDEVRRRMVELVGEDWEKALA